MIGGGRCLTSKACASGMELELTTSRALEVGFRIWMGSLLTLGICGGMGGTSIQFAIAYRTDPAWDIVRVLCDSMSKLLSRQPEIGPRNKTPMSLRTVFRRIGFLLGGSQSGSGMPESKSKSESESAIINGQVLVTIREIDSKARLTDVAVFLERTLSNLVCISQENTRNGHKIAIVSLAWVFARLRQKFWFSNYGARFENRFPRLVEREAHNGN